jgi:hypothetical protein
MKTGPVIDVQQTKQYVHNIPCDCGRSYIGETIRLLEVHIKEHKYNLTQDAQRAYKKGYSICASL